MLDRIAALRAEGRIRIPEHAGVLVKSPKPTQDRRIDLPSLGPRTVEKAARPSSPALPWRPARPSSPNPLRVAEAADRAGLFVIGRRRPGAAAMTRRMRSAGRELTVCIIAAEAVRGPPGCGADARPEIQAGRRCDLIGIGGGEMLGGGTAAAGPASALRLHRLRPDRASAGDLSLYPRRRRCGGGGAPGCARHHRQPGTDPPDRQARAQARAPSIPIVNYVSPSVWAWRPGRARAMRAYVDHVLALAAVRAAGARAARRAALQLCRAPADRAIRVSCGPTPTRPRRRQADPPVLLVLPGSRPGEIRRMTGGVRRGDCAAQGSRRRRSRWSCPRCRSLEDSVLAATANWAVQPRVVVDPAEKWAAFRIARAALAKSGTVTLELALAGVPMVTAYKVPLFDEMIARLVDQGAVGHPGQPGHRRERRAGVPAAGLHAREAWPTRLRRC